MNNVKKEFYIAKYLNAAKHFQGIQEWNARPDTNWDLCFICQENSTAKLICPANSSSDDGLKSYENILHKLKIC